jgi:RNA polymerase sigma factor (sigma-70 family)
MAAQANGLIRHLRKIVLLQDDGGMPDGQLLKCFLGQRDEAAFAALVRRHGPMVLGVCRRILHNAHDAEDAFQATFLVLVRKARSIGRPELLGNWLYGVAYRTALAARGATAKRRARERDTAKPEAVEEDGMKELAALVDRELVQLPEKYRVPIVLCDLEGKTRKEAARQLGWPEGTMHGRLARGRILLARRLRRQGIAFSSGTMAALLAQSAACADVPASVAVSTIQAAGLVAAGPAAAAGVISPKVAALAEGVVKVMLLSKLKATVAVVLVLGFLMTGAAVLTYRAATARGATPVLLDAEARAKTPQKKVQPADKESFTAWGKEVGGLQAGLGYSPGQKRAYHTGETVRLVVRVRNVSKEALKFEYLRQFFIENPPAVTYPQGELVRLRRVTALGFHIPEKVNLAPGKEIELYECKLDLRPASDASRTGRREKFWTLYGTGKFQIQYERVFGNSSAGKIAIDPDLEKLATGKLELEIRADPPPVREKKEEDKEAEKERQKLLPGGPYRTAPISSDVVAKKEGFTAWGKEINGLQAGLGYDPGQQQATSHGEMVRLTIRVRNVGKKAVRYQYNWAFFINNQPIVTDGEGKQVLGKTTYSGGAPNVPVTLDLPAGKDIELYASNLELKPGKYQVEYKQVFGNSPGAVQIELDPILSKLATGKLQLEIKSAPPPPPATEKNRRLANEPSDHAAPSARPATAAKELSRFQGTWILVSSERNGRATSEEKNPYTLTFTGGKWKVHRGDEVAVEGTVRLVDVSATPRKFDLVKPSRLAPITTVDYGIYEFQGDTLRYCTRNGPAGSGIDTPDLRPRDFTTRDGDGRTLYVWKRLQPAANPLVEQPNAGQGQRPGELVDRHLERPAWGKPSKGLRLGLQSADRKGDGKSRLFVILDNVSDEDLVLNLGRSFARGKKHEMLTVLRLHLTDSGGRERVLLPKGPILDHLRDGAQVSNFVIQLVAGGRYVIPCDLNAFFDPKDVKATLPPGRYRATAQFLGKAAASQDGGTGNMLASIPYWTGTVHSDSIPVVLPAKPASRKAEG